MKNTSKAEYSRVRRASETDVSSVKSFWKITRNFEIMKHRFALIWHNLCQMHTCKSLHVVMLDNAPSHVYYVAYSRTFFGEIFQFGENSPEITWVCTCLQKRWRLYFSLPVYISSRVIMVLEAVRYCQHRSDSGPVLVDYGRFIGIKPRRWPYCKDNFKT